MAVSGIVMLEPASCGKGDIDDLREEMRKSRLGIGKPGAFRLLSRISETGGHS